MNNTSTNDTSTEALNKKTLETFYSAFQRRDGETMAKQYAPTAHFEDAVFKLDGSKVGSMWKMLCESGKDLKVTYSISDVNKNTGKAHWTAVYTFAATGRKVINHVSATFEFKDGQILRHKDTFSFWKWSSQALGPIGSLLGWTSVIRGRVQSLAARNLENYIKNHQETP